jgi:hypothetical protein
VKFFSSSGVTGPQGTPLDKPRRFLFIYVLTDTETVTPSRKRRMAAVLVGHDPTRLILSRIGTRLSKKNPCPYHQLVVPRSSPRNRHPRIYLTTGTEKDPTPPYSGLYIIESQRLRVPLNYAKTNRRVHSKRQVAFTPTSPFVPLDLVSGQSAKSTIPMTIHKTTVDHTVT